MDGGRHPLDDLCDSVEPMTQDAALDVLLRAYADEPFVQVVDHLPATKDVAHTNYCHLTARIVKGALGSGFVSTRSRRSRERPCRISILHVWTPGNARPTN
ncbi:MAG: hypothetical protein R3B96_20560 [Pirellulaceae bacterium]